MNTKKILITLCLCLALVLPTLCACAEQAAEITKKCTIKTSSGSPGKLTNGKMKDYWEAKKSESTITITLPKGTQAGGLQIEWFEKFDAFEVKQYDSEGALLNETDSEGLLRAHVSWFDLDSRTAKIELIVHNKGRICGLHVYSAGEYAPEVQRWRQPAEKIDLMLIVAHQDDEELWFGGLLPYYDVVRGANVQTVYMTSCGRARIQESLNGLWVMGIQTTPDVVGFKNSYSSVKESQKLWGGKENIERSLVRLIRFYKPEVIVTHDLKGEYGHPQHKLIAQSIESAVISAADESKYPESAGLYGAWQVKKVYLHLSDTNTIYMDWNTPEPALGGKTPLEVATLGYKQHKSQQSRYNMSMGKKYDYTKFGLIFTTVGVDEAGDDFLEHTDAQ